MDYNGFILSRIVHNYFKFNRLQNKYKKLIACEIVKIIWKKMKTSAPVIISSAFGHWIVAVDLKIH